MTLEIRPVRPGEENAAGALVRAAYEHLNRDRPDLQHAWRDYIERLGDVAGRSHRTTVLVALRDGVLVGCVTIEIDARIDSDSPPPAPDEAHVRMLAVAPDAQHGGVGRALMEACIAVAREQGRTRVTLNTGSVMVAARKLYESMGFQLVSDEEMHHGRLYGYSLGIASRA